MDWSWDELKSAPLVERGVFTFGKHAGEAVAAVARADSDFLRWVLESKHMLALGPDEVVECERAWLEVAVPPPPPFSSTDIQIVEEGKPNNGQMVAVPSAVFRKEDADAWSGKWTVGGGGPVDARGESSCGKNGVGTVVMQSTFSWTDEQKDALEDIGRWHTSGEIADNWTDLEEARPMVALSGFAGTGKTTMVRELIARYPEAVLTAMTGKAALRLAELTGREASTLHKVMYWPPNPGESDFTRLRDPAGSLIIVDECSMMGGATFQHLKMWGPRAILVGDPFQLPPVVTGRELEQFGEDYSVFIHVQGPELRTVMRNSGGVLRAATHVRETGEVFTESTDGYSYLRTSTPIGAALDRYFEDRSNAMLITWRNEVRMRATKIIRERLGLGGPLPDTGEPVLVRRNGQGFLNGEIAICGGFETGPMIDSVRTMWMILNGARTLVSVGGREEFFDGGLPKIDSWKRYHTELKAQNLPEPLPCSWGYCLTVHQAQGSQAERAIVFLDRGDSRSTNFRKPTKLPSGKVVPHSARFIYTAITRAQKHATLVVGS